MKCKITWLEYIISYLAINYLKITTKLFWVAILIFPQYLTSVQSSPINESKINKLSDELLISGWKPLSNKNI